MFAFRAADQFLKKLDNLEYGRFELTTPDGRTRVFEGRQPGSAARLSLHDWRVVANLAVRGDIGFAEDYKAGLWETACLPDLLSLAMENDRVIDGYIFGSSGMQLMARLSQLLRLNTVSGSKKNISAHYDLGNDFYNLWLDPSMTYSSAIFANPDENLETAQMRKYDRIIDRLGSSAGRILEIGCGWGGFAARAADRGAGFVKGVTLSEKQRSYAAQRLGGKAQIALEDYRHQNGVFDHIVSIEMFEAVGERYWPMYFEKVSSLLRRGGKAVIQTITIEDSRFEKYRQSGDFIRSYIFPGGMLPSPARFRAEAEKAGFVMTDRFDFGKDYATTLERWLHNFDARRDDIAALGYDEGFMRMWRFYLAACIAGFRTGRTDVMQVELQHA